MKWTLLALLLVTCVLSDLGSHCLPFNAQNSLDDYDYTNNGDSDDDNSSGGVQDHPGNDDPFLSFKFDKIGQKPPSSSKEVKGDEKVKRGDGGHHDEKSFHNFEQLKKRIKAVKGDHGDEDDDKEAVIDDIAEVLKALNLPTDFADGNHTDEKVTVDSKKISLSTSTSPTDQLAALGSHGYSYSTGSHHHHGLFDLGHTTSSGHHGYGQHHVDLEGYKGDILSQLIRLLLAIPSAKLKLLKPLILGFADTAVHATHVAAEVNAHVAKTLPYVIRVKADVLHKLLDTFGDATGSLLYILSQLLSVSASAKEHFSAASLPHLLDVLGYKSEIVASALAEATSTKGKVVSTLVKGGHQLTAGVVEGIQGAVGHHHHYHHPPSPPIYSSSYGGDEGHHHYY